jgi:hypothetical protein
MCYKISFLPQLKRKWYLPNKNYLSALVRNWVSSVNIVQEYRLDDRGLIPGRGTEFLLYPLCPDQL